MFIILSTVYQISMSVLMITVAVNKCVTTYQVHILVGVLMVFSWMKMNSIVSGISKDTVLPIHKLTHVPYMACSKKFSLILNCNHSVN